MQFENYVKLLQIEDRRSGRLVSLELNSVQRRIRAEIDRCLRERIPCRMIILKSRRMGVSTVIQASLAHWAFTTRRFTAMTGAHEDKSSEYLHGMAEQMYEHLPEALKPQKKVGLRGRHLAFTTGSGLRTFTAGGRAGVGRSFGTRAIHASEVAFYPDPAETMLAVSQIVPDEPDTLIALESTAYGLNYFHQQWLRAKRGESEYVPLFFPWYEFEEYRMRVPEVGLGLAPSDVMADEDSLRALGCDDEQLQWRRYTIANKCGGKLDRFHQEYPATDLEAFLSSGRPYFHNLEQFQPVEPKRVGWFVGDPVPGKRKGKLPITFIPDPKGICRIWEAPKPGVRYAIWADCAGSTILSEYEARKPDEKADAYAAYVIDLQTGRIVASLYGRLSDEKTWAWELARIGRVYRCGDSPALIAVEKVGGYGVATNIYLRDELGYPNLWREVDFDSDQQRDEAGAIGWMTSVTTRPQMLAELEAVLRQDPQRLRDAGLKDEMHTFILNSRGKPVAEVGYHDDRVIAAAGAMRIFSLRAQAIPNPNAPKPKPAPRSIIASAPRIHPNLN